MDLRNEHERFKSIMRQLEWPTPSPDLHDRIMAQIRYPAATVTPSYSMTKLSLCLVTVFVAAFSLGVIQNRALSPYADIYANALYYGGSNLHLYQSLGS